MECEFQASGLTSSTVKNHEQVGDTFVGRICWEVGAGHHLRETYNLHLCIRSEGLGEKGLDMAVDVERGTSSLKILAGGEAVLVTATDCVRRITGSSATTPTPDVNCGLISGV